MPIEKEIEDLYEVVDKRNTSVAVVVEEMREASPKGDPYARAAAKIFGVPIEKVSKKMRQEVKMYAFMGRRTAAYIQQRRKLVTAKRRKTKDERYLDPDPQMRAVAMKPRTISESDLYIQTVLLKGLVRLGRAPLYMLCLNEKLFPTQAAETAYLKIAVVEEQAKLVLLAWLQKYMVAHPATAPAMPPWNPAAEIAARAASNKRKVIDLSVHEHGLTVKSETGFDVVVHDFRLRTRLPEEQRQVAD